MSAVAADAPSRRPRLQPLQGVSDLLVDVERGHGYFDMAGFALGVEDELGRHDPGGDPPWPETPIRDRVLREAVAL